jgi:hypothetical protein
MVWYTHNIGAHPLPADLENVEAHHIVYFNNAPSPDAPIGSVCLLIYPDNIIVLQISFLDSYEGARSEETFRMLLAAPNEPDYYPEPLKSLPPFIRQLIQLAKTEGYLLPLIPHIARVTNIAIDPQEYPLDPAAVEVRSLDLTAPAPIEPWLAQIRLG